MMLDRLRPGRARIGSARKLYEMVVPQARLQALYAVMGAPDTVEGRFELLTLHVILLLDRLRDLGRHHSELRQAVFDAYLSDLDGALREMGVGDLTVGKRMKALGGAFYGRAKAYDEAFKALPDENALRDLIARTILQSAPADATALAAYVLRCRGALGACAESDLLVTCSPSWPAS